MDNTYRAAADPPEECSPENNQKTKSNVSGRRKETTICSTNAVMNIRLTSPTLLVSLSSSLATSVNSLVKKTSSGSTGIYSHKLNTTRWFSHNCDSVMILKQMLNESVVLLLHYLLLHKKTNLTKCVSPGKATPAQRPLVTCLSNTFLHMCSAAISYRCKNKSYFTKEQLEEAKH